MSRASARAAAVGMVYRRLVAPDCDDLVAEELRLDDADSAYAEFVVRGVTEQYDDLTARIGTLARGYTLDRIFRVDLAILLVAAFEIRNAPAIAATVGGPAVNKAIACNEAVELAKRYSTGRSAAFVNGILARIDAPAEGAEQ